MTEFVEPQTTDLVPFDEESARPRLDFSEAQKSQIGTLSFEYVKKNKLPFNSEVLGNVQALIGVDALDRGMVINDLERITPANNIRKIIASGLSERAAVVKEGMGIVNSYKGEAREANRFVGPYALDRSLFLGAAKELEAHKVTPLIRSTDTLVEAHNRRKAMLPAISGAILKALPEELFSDASIDKFPTAEDQAKIIRNMITSLVFRGNPLPAISIDELRNFDNVFDQNSDKFNAEILDGVLPTISQLSQLPLEAIKPYLMDLVRQTQESFKISTQNPMPDDMKVRSVDAMYRNYSRQLLLLHPALEETPIVTDITRLDGAERSLWDPSRSVVMHGYRIPTIAGLDQAIRIEEAKGHVPTRLLTALSSWRNYSAIQEKNRNALMEQLNKIDNLKQTLKEATASGYYPEIYFNLSRTTNISLNERYVAEKNKVTRFETIIANQKEDMQRIEEYFYEVMEQNGGTIPDEFVAPAEIIENYNLQLKSRRGSAENRLNRVIERSENALLTDIFGSRLGLGKDGKINLRSMAEDELRDTITKLAITQQAVLSSPEDTIELPGITNEVIKEYFTDTLKMYEYRIKKRNIEISKGLVLSISNSSLSDAEYEAKQIMENMQHAVSGNIAEGEKGIPKKYYLYCLEKRATSALNVLKAIQEFQRTEAELKLKAEEKPKMKREELEYIIKLQGIATAPMADGYEPHEFEIGRDNMTALSKAFKKPRAAYFPAIIPSASEFRQWVDREIENQENHTTHRENRLNMLKKLNDNFDNPLFPLHDLEGIKGADLASAILSRTAGINAQLYLEKSRTQALKYEAELTGLGKVSYRNSLNRRIKEAEDRANYLRTKDYSKDVVEDMKKMLLAQEVTQ